MPIFDLRGTAFMYNGFRRTVHFWMYLRQLLADPSYELILRYFCNADIYRAL